MPKSNVFVCFSELKRIQLIQKQPYLRSNDILIYSIYLPDYVPFNSDLLRFLNPLELDRAKRFYNEIDKNRFITYRSILKLILASHTNLDAKSIVFENDWNKKPYLASHPWLHFNMSHSQDFAVIAISRNKVGIDIEFMSDDFKFTNLLFDIFDDQETSIIQNANHKKETFYNLWTRKEALVKGTGKGINEDFKSTPCLDGEHYLDSIFLNHKESWKVYGFDLAPDYAGAIAFENFAKNTVNIVLYTIPNTVKDILEIMQVKSKV